MLNHRSTKMTKAVKTRDHERGSAGIKFLIVLLVIIVVANAGYSYLPVAYNAENLKSEMSTAVLQGIAMPGKINPVDNVKARIAKAIQQNDIPPDALVDVKQVGNAISAHVVYAKDVNILPFGIYKYHYHFDHTATPTGFLLKQ
jgi:hypothetical protein